MLAHEMRAMLAKCESKMDLTDCLNKKHGGIARDERLRARASRESLCCAAIFHLATSLVSSPACSEVIVCPQSNVEN